VFGRQRNTYRTIVLRQSIAGHCGRGSDIFDFEPNDIADWPSAEAERLITAGVARHATEVECATLAPADNSMMTYQPWPRYRKDDNRRARIDAPSPYHAPAP